MDTDDINHRQARALLITARAVTRTDCEQCEECEEDLCTQLGTKRHAVQTELSKMMRDLSFLAASGGSARWTRNGGGFAKVMDSSFGIFCQSTSISLRNQARGKFKCQLCGTYEEHCKYVIHFMGTPTVERGENLGIYSAKAFVETSDPDILYNAYEAYRQPFDDTAAGLEPTNIAFPMSIYLGAVVPGNDCMKRIFAAFHAQDFVRAAFADAWRGNPTRNDVMLMASKLQQLKEVAAGHSAPPHDNTEERVWHHVLQRFADEMGIEMGDELGFLRAAYTRMEHSIQRTTPLVAGPSMNSDELEESDDEIVSKPKRRRRQVVPSSEEESEQEEDEEESEGSDSWLVEDSDDEDGDDEPEPRARAPERWGSTETSCAGPFATAPQRRRRGASEALLAPPESRVTRRRGTAEPAPSSTPAEPEDRIMSAYSSGYTSTTAAELRKHPNNAIHSRLSSLQALAAVQSNLMAGGQLVETVAVARAMATFALLLNKKNQCAAPSAAEKTREQKVVTPLHRLVANLVNAGMQDDARRVVEAILVLEELLG